MAFKWYGVVGLLLMLLVELNFIFKIEPLASFYFLPAWLGFILFFDALIYKLQNNSLLMNNRNKFFFLAALSVVVWWIYELINIKVGNWDYNAVFGWRALGGFLRKSLYFATVIPAVFEMAELFKSFHWFDKLHLKHGHKISKQFLRFLIFLGVLSVVLPLLWPKVFYPLIWLSFFLLLDPVNYVHKEPSLIKHLQDRKLLIPVVLTFAGLTCGLFWEFWNFWATTKWYYHIPIFGFWKIFEMPLLGYLGYVPFAWSLYSIYHYINSLWKKNEEDII